MRIALASGPAGFLLEEKLRVRLAAMGHAITDHGTRCAGSCDCPDLSQAVAEAGAGGRAERGLMICTTFLETEFTGQTRHLRRVAKIAQWEHV
jgi:ribose 5-phosphate isomerase B